VSHGTAAYVPVRPRPTAGKGRAMSRVPSLGYFIGAWFLALPTVLLSGSDKGFLAFGLGAGLLMLLAGWRVLADPNDPWNRFNNSLPRGMSLWGGGLASRVITGVSLLVLGALFVGAGVVGLGSL
jgi:hypothetical protein